MRKDRSLLIPVNDGVHFSTHGSLASNLIILPGGGLKGAGESAIARIPNSPGSLSRVGTNVI